MKTAHVICDLQKANENADKAFNQKDYQGAVECYNKALKLCRQLPKDTTFDQCRFEAVVHAGLSAAYGRLGKHMEGFAAANKALVFFEQVGDLNAVETGRFLMAQVNQGAALAALGCLPAALEALQRAKDLFAQKGLDCTANRGWLEQVDGNIAAIKVQMEKLQR
jgi:tetratricopeptide (TPR) repeat protein